MLRHKAGVENKAADALSRRISLLVAMSVETIGFERIREEYATCPDFGEIYTLLRDGLTRERDYFFLQDGYLFCVTQLCVPKGQPVTSLSLKSTREDSQVISEGIRQSS